MRGLPLAIQQTKVIGECAIRVEAALKESDERIKHLEGLLKEVREAGAKAAGVYWTEHDRDYLIRLCIGLQW